MNAIENKLTYLLQKGIPLMPRPFAELGRQVNSTEAETLRLAHRLFREGIARRLGAVFDARRLGYKSVLCALSLSDASRLEDMAKRLIPQPGITHLYERGWPEELDPCPSGGPQGETLPNLWFTLSVLREEYDHKVAEIRAAAGPYDMLLFPARTRFKIEVIFDPDTLAPRGSDAGVASGSKESEPADDAPGPASFTEDQRNIVRLLQGNLTAVPDFFGEAARHLAMSEAALLDQLRRWQVEGVLRRVGLIVRHREMGFKANAMCVWRVPKNRVAAAGCRLASFREVTHCYERETVPGFPYNLYAMIHQSGWPAIRQLFVHLSETVGISGGRQLCSLREFKKSSMAYFIRAEGK